MLQVRVLFVDAAVVILETQTAGSSAITLIPSSLSPYLPLSIHQTTRACILSTDITVNRRTELLPWSPCIELFTVLYYEYDRTFYGLRRVFPARTRTVYLLIVNSNGTVQEIERPYYGMT
jgi:hypothetical protein